MILLSEDIIVRLKYLGLYVIFTLCLMSIAKAEDTIEFNTDVLDLNDRKNIDLSHFSRGSYIMPGVYGMVVKINNHELPEQQIPFYAPENDPGSSRACISRDLINKLGFKENEIVKFTWWHQGECLDDNSIKGMEVRGELSTSSLYLSIPQIYLEYADENWDPPSRWDEGITGILFDYNVNTNAQRLFQNGTNVYNFSGNGVAGLNLGSWRIRSDWQAILDYQSGSEQPLHKTLDWTRYYLYRAIPTLHSKLTLGENYLDSGIFDSFRFTGASLVSDDNMLPPNLRGYAPEVSGVAKTNAKITISQQGRVLYETTVASGPFRIQDLNDAVSGKLDVKVEELDGSVQTFTINTANLPYLTRPGMVRFKLAAGKPSDIRHQTQGQVFTTGELSWGGSKGWSLYGGALVGGDYNALAMGIGRDLLALGAISFDITHAQARLPEKHNTLLGGGTLSGQSYRLSYSKSFEEYDSQVTFAGYRFSEKEFMSMSQYLDARYNGYVSGNGKDMYSVNFNKSFHDLRLSTYFSYSHQTFWNQPENDRYNFTLSHFFNIGQLRNLSVSLSGYRNIYNGENDDGAYFSLSIPWGNDGSLSYNAAVSNNITTHNASYYGRLDERSSYQVSSGTSDSGENASGYYTHEGDMARYSGNISYQSGKYSSIGFSAIGGMTLTAEGGALHRINMNGGTRLMIDTDGVSDVPVRGYGRISRTNIWGKTVIGDVNSYYRNKATIDLNQLGDKAEATTSVVQATLTEGAIGYRKFEVIAGDKAMAVIKLTDGSHPPFGAIVMNERKQETGIVNDSGSVYLTGLKGGDVMTVSWNGAIQCEIRMPSSLPTDMIVNSMLLPCQPISK